MQKVIIFDGVCGLCNKSIDILIRLDKKRIFKYTSLQGEYVKTLGIDEEIDSIIFYDNSTLQYKSTAILKILRSLGGVWIFTSIFYITPKGVRDFIYDIIAKYRYYIFGKMESCRMATEDEVVLFID